MTPETFWGCSVKEFMSAMEGYKMKVNKGKKAQPLLRDELEDLMRRFPD
jgi:uncharacterized phage protein (TIGR02216 family)